MPVTITTDKCSQFESVLFAAIAEAINGTELEYLRITQHQTEWLHRTLKFSLICNQQIPCGGALTAVLLRKWATYKENVHDRHLQQILYLERL